MAALPDPLTTRIGITCVMRAVGTVYLTATVPLFTKRTPDAVVPSAVTYTVYMPVGSPSRKAGATSALYLPPPLDCTPRGVLREPSGEASSAVRRALVIGVLPSNSGIS